jgi:hypothetical protein
MISKKTTQISTAISHIKVEKFKANKHAKGTEKEELQKFYAKKNSVEVEE